MIDLKRENRFCTTNEQFFQLGDKSSLGILLIQKGYLKYVNKRFGEIFGYSMEELFKWKKREFYKIVHPDDLANLTQNFIIDGNQVIIIRFRGIKKDGSIIPIENNVCIVQYNNKKAMFSSYTVLINSAASNALETIKIEIELPNNFQMFFDYLELNFGLNKKNYIEDLIQIEIKSRNEDLNLF